MCLCLCVLSSYLFIFWCVFPCFFNIVKYLNKFHKNFPSIVIIHASVLHIFMLNFSSGHPSYHLRVLYPFKILSLQFLTPLTKQFPRDFPFHNRVSQGPISFQDTVPSGSPSFTMFSLWVFTPFIMLSPRALSPLRLSFLGINTHIKCFPGSSLLPQYHLLGSYLLSDYLFFGSTLI